MSREWEAAGTAGAPILAEAVRMGRAIREAARKAGMQPDDPMAPLVEALARAVMFVGQQCATVASTTEAVVERLGSLLSDGHAVADAEADRFRAQCQAAEAETIESLSTALADAAASAFGERVRAIDRRTAALVAIGLVTALCAGAAGGWWAGVTTTRAAIGETETGLRVAFRDGPETARLWLELMTWNDPRTAVIRCRDAGRIREEAGRKSCPLLFWVSPPVAAPTP